MFRRMVLVSALLIGGCAKQQNAARTETKSAAPAVESATGVAASNETQTGKSATTNAIAEEPAAPIYHGKLPSATNPRKAWEQRMLQWQDENGEIAQDAYCNAMEQRAANIGYWEGATLRDTAGIDPLDWQERGPFNVGGRTRSLSPDPANPDRLLAGAVSGGLWKSEDGGVSWSPVNDWLPNLAVCCLARDPQNSSTIYAGTGEGFFNYDAVGGAGIFRSTDNGDTWVQIPSTADWDNICRIAVSPTDSNVILAAKTYGGVMGTTDGGLSWSTRYGAQGSFFVAFNPADGTKAVAHVIDYDFGIGDWFHRAMVSSNSGMTWTPATGGLERRDGFGSRIELAYAPSDPNVVYASSAGDGAIWKSTDGGQSYASQTTSGSLSSSWYANPLWVDPTNPDFLVCGGYNFLKSLNGGASLITISSGYIMTIQPHVDNHFIVHDPGFDGVTNRRVYVCTDGGIWKTENIYTANRFGNGNWVNLDMGYRATQFYGAAGDGPSGLIIGGTQDNGTLQLISSSNIANLMYGGDGGFCAIDPTDPTYCYGEYITLQIHRSTNGGVSSSDISSGIGDAGGAANFIAPFILDPNNPNRLLGGGASLWRSNNVKAPSPSWANIGSPGSSNISAIAVAPGNSDVIFIGHNNGEVYRTSNGTAGSPAWTAVDDNGGVNPLPNRYVTRILIDPDDNNVVYASFGGFSANNLRKSIDGGDTWTSITGFGPTGLPQAPIRGIARHPDRADWLYVGTEVGVFATTNGGATWSASNEGPANASVDELVFMHNSTTLLAATHGRGIFTAEVRDGVFGDFDGDGDVDLDDFSALSLCFGGANNPPAGSCPPGVDADFDNDGDVDLGDFAMFALNFTGAL